MTTPLLTDHAVLQRDTPIPLRGIASPGVSVSAAFRHANASGIANADGNWSLTLPPMPAGGPDDLTLKIAGETVVYRDILVGDVWICAGQSNMDMPLAKIDGADAELAHADNPLIRLLRVPRAWPDSPQRFLSNTAWQPSNATTAADFSAVGFVFGQRLQRATNIPVGLIHAAVGETPCETWLSRAALEADGSYESLFERVKKSNAAFPDPEQNYRKAFIQWDHDADLAEREGRHIPGAYPRLIGPSDKWNPGACFNGMIAPLTHTPIAGVVWYQGAGAPDRAYQYRRLFKLLINDWRHHWRNPAMPFYFVQEARFGPTRDQPCEHSWAELREAQAMALSLPHTAMAVAIDTGHATDPHPTDKIPLGERLALHALANLHGQNIPHESPTLDSITRADSAIHLHFKHTYGHLRTSDNQPPRGFAISPGTTDFSQGHRGFQWAHAQINGDTITLTCDAVARPIAARYAWAQNPNCNVVNAAGLPLAPFRTDDWPGVTPGNE